jgi:hypothetical protein
MLLFVWSITATQNDLEGGFMRILGNILGTTLALALTAALAFGGYLAVKRFVAFFVRLDFQIAMVTVIGTVALLLAAMIVAGSIRRAAAQNRAAQLRAEKAEAYKCLIDLWDELLRSGQAPDSSTQLSQQMRNVNHALVLHGSAAVVKGHLAMQSLDLSEARNQFGTLLLQIRKDLGSGTRSLSAPELLQLLQSDFDQPAAPIKANPVQDLQPRVSLFSHSSNGDRE